MRSAKNSPKICVAVRQMIEESDLTREDVAKSMDVDPSTVSRWMTTTEPSYDTVAELEVLVRRKPGYAAKLAGYYVPEGKSIKEQLLEYEAIENNARPIVIAVIEAAEQSARDHRSKR